MKKIKISAIGVSLVTLSLLFFSCSKSNSDLIDDSANNPIHSTQASLDHRVYMKNSTFSPSLMTLTAGKPVAWINDDNQVHRVTADDGSFDSGDMQPGATFSRTFNAPGTFPYHCKYHKGMTGTVITGAIR
ncbi:MAG TPA: cupredoxin domain-containing protein [Chitinophagaceae bacterium]|nr:cupredoxin domain-containing protein [Chitinophagaceae bacterium]